MPGTQINKELTMRNLIVLFLLILVTSCNQQPNIIEITLVGSETETIFYPEGFMYEAISIGNDHIITWSRNVNYFELYDYGLNSVRTIGSMGYGPGEFQRIDDVFWIDKYIIAYDQHKKTYEYFTEDGSYFKGIIIDKRITSTVVKNDTTLIVNVLEPNASYVIELSGEDLKNERYLFFKNHGELLMNYNSLAMDNTHIIVMSTFTNKAYLINKDDLTVRTLDNKIMPTQPGFSYVSDIRIPKSPVWRTGLKINDIFLKARNLEGGVAEIFRYQSNGSIDLKFELPLFISKMFVVDKEVWIFTTESLLKFPINVFSQDYHDYN